MLGWENLAMDVITVEQLLKTLSQVETSLGAPCPEQESRWKSLCTVWTLEEFVLSSQYDE